MKEETRYLRLSFISFLVTALICFSLQPSTSLYHEGLSYYGNHKNTIAVFGMGILCTVYFLFKYTTHRHIAAQKSQSFKTLGFNTIALGLLLILATPSESSVTLIRDLHVVIGVAVFVIQFLLSLYFLRTHHYTTIDVLLLTVQLIATVIAALSLGTINIVSLMFPAQLVSVTAFGILSLRMTKIQKT